MVSWSSDGPMLAHDDVMYVSQSEMIVHVNRTSEMRHHQLMGRKWSIVIGGLLKALANDHLVTAEVLTSVYVGFLHIKQDPKQDHNFKTIKTPW